MKDFLANSIGCLASLVACEGTASVSARRMFGYVLLIFWLFLPPIAFGETYPDRPITLIVGSSAGSSIDFVARTYSQYLAEHLGQPVIVQNRPGANGEIATSVAARSKPDGYSLLIMGNNNLIQQEVGRSQYNVLKDFSPISLSGRAPWVLSVSATSPFHSIKDVVDYAHKEPGKLTYVSIGGGSIPEFLGEALARSGNLRLLPVPYSSTSDAKTDVLTGRVTLWFTSLATVLAMQKSGQMRALGVAGESPPNEMKNVPTMKQAGYESLDVESLYFFLAPAGTSLAIVNRLNREINNAQKDQTVIKRLGLQGVFPSGGDVNETTQAIRNDISRWDKAIKAAQKQ
jgi:tripartite-type tricarboxylate transporter receptor subunit TctC